MNCKTCKFRKNIGNTEEKGIALCTYSTLNFLIKLTDDCHYLPKKKELTCGDCERYGDLACGCLADEPAYHDGKLCVKYTDKRISDLSEILIYLKVQGLYNRSEIESILDETDKFFEELAEPKCEIHTNDDIE